MTKKEIKQLAIKQLSEELNIADYFIRVDKEDEFVDRCIELSQVKNNAALSGVMGSVCKECNGNGMPHMENVICVFCEGTGRTDT